MQTDEAKAEPAETPKVEPVDKNKLDKLDKLVSILNGEKPIYLNLQFLIRNDRTDPLILKQTKDAVRVSICHTATVIANGFQHSGTTHDQFLRDNLGQALRYRHPGRHPQGSREREPQADAVLPPQ